MYRQTGERANEFVEDKFAYAICIIKKWRPFLLEVAREDVEQEIHLLIAEHPGEMTMNEWSRIVHARDHHIARRLGFAANSRYSAFVKETPFAEFRDDEADGDDGFVDNVLLEYHETSNTWVAEAMYFCKEVIQNVSSEWLADWKLWSAYIGGWTAAELRLSFRLDRKQILKRLCIIANWCRQELGMEPLDSIPYPRQFSGDISALKNALGIKGTRNPRQRIEVSDNMNYIDIMTRYAVSRTTAWRIRQRGWLIIGYQIPDESLARTTIMDPDDPQTKLQIAARDGWHVEDESLKVKCQRCGNSILLSEAIVAKKDPLRANLGNLQLVCRGC